MFLIARFQILFLLLAVLPSCGHSQQDFAIRFAAGYGDQPLHCSGELKSTQLVDLRFFVSDLFLLNDDGTEVPLQLIPDQLWQNETISLIDLEDGSGACQNGTAATNTVVTGRAPAGEYHGLRFTLGVPEELNHGDPLIAAAPLTDTAMHWHWRSGYKFLRAGLQRGTERYRLHLGSARCHGVIGNLQGCDAGNRVDVLHSEFDSDSERLVFDFAKLLAEFHQQEEALQDCEMGPDETACDGYRVVLGLAEDGSSIRPTSIFRVEALP